MLDLEPRSSLPLSYIPSPIFNSLFWNRVSLSSWGWLQTQILLSQPPKCWDYKCAPPLLTCLADFSKIKLQGLSHVCIKREQRGFHSVQVNNPFNSHHAIFLGIRKTNPPKWISSYLCSFFILFLFYLFIYSFIFVVLGMEPRGILPPSYIFSAFLFFIWNRVSPSCGESH